MNKFEILEELFFRRKVVLSSIDDLNSMKYEEGVTKEKEMSLNEQAELMDDQANWIERLIEKIID